MSSFVLDASIALAWLVDRSVSPYAERVRQMLFRGNRAVVPALWQWEVANGFVIAERRGTLTEADTAAVLRNFDAVLPSIEIRHEPISIRRVIGTARASRMTAYDASYLELARELQLPIATLDRSLVDAAKRSGIGLIH